MSDEKQRDKQAGGKTTDVSAAEAQEHSGTVEGQIPGTHGTTNQDTAQGEEKPKQ